MMIIYITTSILRAQQTRDIDGHNVGLLLAHRLRRWPNIIPTLSKSLVFVAIQLRAVVKKIYIYPPEDVSRYRDPQLQVGKNDFHNYIYTIRIKAYANEIFGYLKLCLAGAIQICLFQ